MPQLQFEKFKSASSRRRLMDRQRRSFLALSALGAISEKQKEPAHAFQRSGSTEIRPASILPSRPSPFAAANLTRN
jgi:hypothetical protein